MQSFLLKFGFNLKAVSILFFVLNGTLLSQELALKSKYSYSTPALEAAQKLYSQKKYPEALTAFEEIISKATQEQNYEEVVYAMERKGLTLRRMNRNDDAISTFDAAIRVSLDKLSKRHFLTSKMYYRRGTMDHSLANYYRARSYLDTAIIYYQNSGSYDSALYKRMVEFKFYAYQYSEGNQDTLLAYIRKLVDLERVETKGNPDPNLILRYLQSYPAIYIQKGDFEQALAYSIQGFQYAMENRERVSDRFFAEAQFHLAQALYYKRDYFKAIEVGLEVMPIVEKIPREQMPEYYSFNNLLGISYMAIGNFSEALPYLEKAAEVINDRGGLINDLSLIKFHTLVLINMGLCYDYLGEKNKAENLLLESLDRMKNQMSRPNPDFHRNYERLGDFYASHRNWNEALNAYDSALRNGLVSYSGSVMSFPEDVENRSYSYPDLRTLMKKADALRMTTKDPSNEMDLLLASKNYVQETHKVLRKNREAFMDSEGKLFLSENFKRLYEIGIDVCFSLYEQTNEIEYFDRALSFSKQSKAILFLEQSQEFDLVNSDLLSIDIKESYFQVKSTIEGLQRSFYSLIDNSVKSDSVIKLNDSLLSAIKERDHLKDSIKQILKDYDEDFSAVSRVLKDGEEIDLKSGYALIEFFYGEDNVYVLSKSNERISFQKVPIDDKFEKSLNFLINAVSRPPNINEIDDELLLFSESSWMLYSRLLEPSLRELNDDIEHLVLVPDDVLSRVPFEVLLTSPRSSGDGFHSLNYLIKTYAVQYQLSSELLSNGKKSYKSGEGFLGIGFRESGTANVKSSFNSLPGTEREISFLKSTIDGTFLIGETGSKAEFLSKAKEFDILHLAIHGKADSLNRYESSLIFNGEMNNVLNTNDLYIAGLQARLAVLSACESGAGAVNKGEGTFSIARGFALVGVPSVVMSIWKVNDNTTSDLMVNMYKEFLENKKPINEALRGAKIDYLVESDQYSGHPYYWAAFLQFGSDTKYEADRKGYELYFGVVVLALLLSLLTIVLIKRKRAI